MHVQGLFAHSPDTIVGARQHEARQHRKTKGSQSIDSESLQDGDLEPISRSENLESTNWGVRGKMDLVEVDGEGLVVVEYKKGGAPRFEGHSWGKHRLPYGAWPCDVAQVGLYMALLRDNGMDCSRARIHYRETRQNAQIAWDEVLEAFLRDVVKSAVSVSAAELPPPPLLDSPKCPRCSLVEICLPMEHHELLRDRAGDSDNQEEGGLARSQAIPRLIPGSDECASVYVISPGSVIRKRGESVLVEKRDGTRTTVLGKDIGHLAIYGPSQVTQQCLLYLSENGVCITHHTGAGRLIGLTSPLNTKNISLRRSQFRAADEDSKALAISKALIGAKIANQRTILRRYRYSNKRQESAEPQDALSESTESLPPKEPKRGATRVSQALDQLSSCIRRVKNAENLEVVRGYEGEGAATYFGVLPEILPANWKGDFQGRSRRPPRDRVNALLSFGYTMLVKDAINASVGVGLDPMLGFLHTMIPGRPALALDLMEPFRAAWVDVAVFRLLATGGIQHEDFHCSPLGVYLSDAGRRALIGAYERRADEETTHPYFGYRMSVRRLMALDCRLLAKFIASEVELFSPFTTR